MPRVEVCSQVALTESEVATLECSPTPSWRRDDPVHQHRPPHRMEGCSSRARGVRANAAHPAEVLDRRRRSTGAVAESACEPARCRQPRPFSWPAAATRGPADRPAVRCARSSEPSRVRWRGVRGSDGRRSAGRSASISAGRDCRSQRKRASRFRPAARADDSRHGRRDGRAQPSHRATHLTMGRRGTRPCSSSTSTPRRKRAQFSALVRGRDAREDAFTNRPSSRGHLPAISVQELPPAVRPSPETPPSGPAVMPTYNKGPWLQQAIDSVLAQTFTDWELIIVDDGSTDDTTGRARPLFRSADPDPYAGRRTSGRARARNAAIALARGRYIAICDSDDISAPTRFEEHVAFLDAHPEIGIVSAHMRLLSVQPDHSAHRVPHRPRVDCPAVCAGQDGRGPRRFDDSRRMLSASGWVLRGPAVRGGLRTVPAILHPLPVRDAAAGSAALSKQSGCSAVSGVGRRLASASLRPLPLELSGSFGAAVVVRRVRPVVADERPCLLRGLVALRAFQLEGPCLLKSCPSLISSNRRRPGHPGCRSCWFRSSWLRWSICPVTSAPARSVRSE